MQFSFRPEVVPAGKPVGLELWVGTYRYRVGTGRWQTHRLYRVPTGYAINNPGYGPERLVCPDTAGGRGLSPVSKAAFRRAVWLWEFGQ